VQRDDTLLRASATRRRSHADLDRARQHRARRRLPTAVEVPHNLVREPSVATQKHRPYTYAPSRLALVCTELRWCGARGGSTFAAGNLPDFWAVAEPERRVHGDAFCPRESVGHKSVSSPNNPPGLRWKNEHTCRQFVRTLRRRWASETLCSDLCRQSVRRASRLSTAERTRGCAVGNETGSRRSVHVLRATSRPPS
jgi:hypothetical protein